MSWFKAALGASLVQVAFMLANSFFYEESEQVAKTAQGMAFLAIFILMRRDLSK
jgi:hypothetical protein